MLSASQTFAKASVRVYFIGNSFYALIQCLLFFAIADKINVRQAKMQNLLDFFGGTLGSCVILKFLSRNSIVRKLFFIAETIVFHRDGDILSSR